MTKCCKCNSSGTCANCTCKKNGNTCSGCVPGVHNKCTNGGQRTRFTSATQPSPRLSAAAASDVSPVLPSSNPAPPTQRVTFAVEQSLASSCPPVLPAGPTSTMFPLDLEVDFAFHEGIATAYEQVVKWRRNIFNVPYGSAGGVFVDELAGLIKSFADGTPMRKTAWKAVCVACHLLLQNPSTTGSTSTYSQHLERRLALWRAGRVCDLLDEAACIQDHLPRRRNQRKRQSEGLSDAVFSKLVFDGKINSAVRYLSEDSSGGVLSMDDHPIPGSSKTVRDVLLEKHPKASEPPEDVLLSEEPVDVNPIVFERLTPKLIKDIGRRSKGAAGPSGLDSAAWKRMMTCFKQSSNRLCTALASAAYVLCTSDLTGVDLSAFTAARLIPLDKKPGVRPIAVGEVYRRIICKAIMRVIEHDVRSCTAPFQICVGIPSACEAAVHAMDRLFRRPSVQGILLVDASNAFNALNRSAALHNIPRLCPAMGRAFSNTYVKPVRLFVAGGGEISSEEGTCQGDPLAMAAYAVAIMPLIKKLKSACPTTTQCWYADDDGAADNLATLYKYWTSLTEFGPGFGYYPNASKTVLLTKPQHRAEAERLFGKAGVKVTSEGCRYLGGAVGDREFCKSFIASFVNKWTADLRTLAHLAQMQPHAAYAVFTKGLSSRLKYHIRCTEYPPEVFTTLDEVINSPFLSALTGREFTDEQPERILLSLPARFGGLALPMLGSVVAKEFQASQVITQPLVDLIDPGGSCADALQEQDQGKTNATESSASSPTVAAADTSPVMAALSAVGRLTCEERSSRLSLSKEAAKSLVARVSTRQKSLLSTAGEKGVSSWLTVEPLRENGTVLNKSDFRDAICLRYGFPLDGLPTTCVCGADMSIDHAMTCPCGGYPTARHNEVRDLVADAMRSVFRDVEVEPQLLPYETEDLPGRTANRSDEARVDIRARGFWTRQQEAFFDVRVTHPKANLLTPPEIKQQLECQEREKKRQYAARINSIDRGTFTPLVFSTTGMAGRECTNCLKNIVTTIVAKNIDLTYSQVMNHLRCKLSFCLLRWCITCLRGCRASYLRNRTNPFLSECRLVCPP